MHKISIKITMIAVFCGATDYLSASENNSALMASRSATKQKPRLRFLRPDSSSSCSAPTQAQQVCQANQELIKKIAIADCAQIPLVFDTRSQKVEGSTSVEDMVDMEHLLHDYGLVVSLVVKKRGEVFLTTSDAERKKAEALKPQQDAADAIIKTLIQQINEERQKAADLIKQKDEAEGLKKIFLQRKRDAFLRRIEALDATTADLRREIAQASQELSDLMVTRLQQDT